MVNTDLHLPRGAVYVSAQVPVTPQWKRGITKKYIYLCPGYCIWDARPYFTSRPVQAEHVDLWSTLYD